EVLFRSCIHGLPEQRWKQEAHKQQQAVLPHAKQRPVSCCLCPTTASSRVKLTPRSGSAPDTWCLVLLQGGSPPLPPWRSGV
ncbi:unnamed protein product, partial [Ectocarpus sp. 6 AP-2014]